MTCGVICCGVVMPAARKAGPSWGAGSRRLSASWLSGGRASASASGNCARPCAGKPAMTCGVICSGLVMPGHLQRRRNQRLA